MPKIRSVVVWTLAALVTAGIEIIGLHRAIALRNQLDTEPSCPVPAAMAEAPAVPAIHKSPKPDVQISLLSVRDDSVEIEVDGRRHELPGYPPPRSRDHRPARLTTAVVAPDGGLIAIAGECSGSSGVSEPRTPSCVPVFVRLYRVADGSHVRDLKMRWRHADNDERRPIAMAFDERAERLAVLVQATWSDCSWSGHYLELVVYSLADGAGIARRVFTTEHPGETHSLFFDEDEVHLLTTSAHAYPKTRVVRLRKPGAA